MNGKFQFDTSAIIHYFRGTPEWVVLIDALAGEARYASVITRMELLVFPEITKGEEEGIYRFLMDITVMPLDDGIESIAIEIRRKTRLKLPDAIVAATAVHIGATLITGDKKLASLAWPGFKTTALFP